MSKMIRKDVLISGTMRWFILTIAVTGSLLLLQNCANPVSPGGGPKDIAPPVLLRAIPPIYSTNFTEKEIRLYFDEFIELKNINQQMIISPPMENPLNFKIRGKMVVINIMDPLKENTTYTFYFGNAFTDITENNPLPDFLYVFSTGDVLDSLSIEGTLVKAFETEPAAGINMMLYLDNSDTISLDSMPYNRKPFFMTRTNDQGKFRFNNLPDETFLLFALEDVNGSLTYDQPNEKIAFYDSLVKPYYIFKEPSLMSLLDTIEKEEVKPIYAKPDPLALFLFQEADTVQKFIRSSIIKEKQLAFVFKLPAQNPLIKPLNVDESYDWYMSEINKGNDTITFWIKEYPADTVIFEVADMGVIYDTVKVRLKTEPFERRRRTDIQEDTTSRKPFMKITLTRGSPELNQPFQMSFDYPVVQSDPSKILFIESEDTLQAHFIFEDSVRRKASVVHPWKESTAYRIVIPENTFTDLAGHINDTIVRQFSTKSEAEYGRFIADINFQNAGTNHIIQLMQKENVIREFNLNENGRITFDYLNPGSYKLKVIYDENGNGKWDTGSYADKRQPERVGFFPSEIIIRANWDIEESWEL